MHRAEHIVLESDLPEAPPPVARRPAHAALQCRSRLRRRTLSLRIIEYCYLEVTAGRGRASQTYVLDLRFVDPRFVLSRHVPWRLVWTALVLTAAAAASALWYAAGAPSRPPQLAAEIAGALLACTAIAYAALAMRVLETVVVYSLHGRAPLLEYRGGVGTLRRMRPFMHKLEAHVRFAAASRTGTLARHLRDELREHFRLKEAGVLSRETYDACKVRILGKHGVGRVRVMPGVPRSAARGRRQEG